MDEMTRREATRLIGGATGSLLLSGVTASAATEPEMLRRPIPSSGEMLPVIGLGTWQVFDVGSSPEERRPLEEVLASFVKNGGKLVDSSPMYERAEAVVGEIAEKLRLHDSLFLATKVWTEGKADGIASMERSLELMKTKRIDLMQVHNLIDVRTQLATLRDWKKDGRARYIGITHYTASAHDEVARMLEKEPVDFVQINYSIMEHEADERVLSVAKDRGVAVIVNRPFGSGALFGKVRGQPLPEWAAEFDCKSWAQFFLKWVVGHPATTCAIPATNKVAHLEDNMQAGTGRLPDEKIRKRMLEAVANL